MYSNNGTYYNEEHSISFIKMDFAQRTYQTVANTWTDWHLIPASKPVVAPPSVQIKMVEIPGSDMQLDLTDYLTGKPQYGLRSGSFSFFVDNSDPYTNPEAIRSAIMTTIHGKKMQMILRDDPDFYYNGRFTVGNFEPGESRSRVTINYQLDPYIMSIYYAQYEYTLSSNTRNITLYAYDYMYRPVMVYESGASVTGTFGGITRTVNTSNRSMQLGLSSEGANTLTLTGTGKVLIYHEEGHL